MRVLKKDSLYKLKNGEIAIFVGPEPRPVREKRTMKKGESKMQRIELIKVTELNGEENYEYLCFEDVPEQDEPISREDVEYAIQFLSALVEPENEITGTAIGGKNRKKRSFLA